MLSETPSVPFETHEGGGRGGWLVGQPDVVDPHLRLYLVRELGGERAARLIRDVVVQVDHI